MEDTVQYLLEKMNVITANFKGLETCELNPRAFLKHRDEIQQV